MRFAHHSLQEKVTEMQKNKDAFASPKKGTHRNICLMKKGAHVSLSFLLPVLLAAISFLIIGVHPFGDKSTLLIDGKLQYVAFFSEYLRRLRDFELPFFSRFFGLGMNFYGTWAYYLASPVNLLLLFFSKAHLLDGIFVVLLAKIGLCGLSFYTFARRTLSAEKWTALLFSTSYALCGFVVFYSDNMQWIDGVIWLPILIMGIETIRQKGRCVYYPFAVAALIISDFYIAVMVGIFCVLYILFVMIRDRRENFPSGRARFGVTSVIFSVLGIGMAGFILLPVFKLYGYSLTMGSRETLSSVYTVNPIRTIGGLFFGRTDFFNETSLPKIYSGLPAIILAPAFFLASGIKKREKIWTAIFLAFVFLCFHISALNYVWHGFDAVSFFPFRYSFVFSFLLLVISVRAMPSAKVLLAGKKTFFFIYVIAVMVVCIISFALTDHPGDRSRILLMAAANLVFILSYAYYLTKESPSRVFLVLLCVELFISLNITLKTLDSAAEYSKYGSWNRKRAAVEALIESENLNVDSGRTAIATETLSANDPLLFGLQGIDCYSSSRNLRLLNTLYSLGYSPYIERGYDISDNSGTLLMNSLLGFSTSIVDSSGVKNDEIPPAVFPGTYFSNSGGFDQLTAIANPYALPLAYMVDEDILNFSTDDSQENPYALADRLLTCMTGKEASTFKNIAYTTEFENVTVIDALPEYTEYRQLDLSREGTVTYQFYGLGENIPVYMSIGYGLKDSPPYLSGLSIDLIRDGTTREIVHPDSVFGPFNLSLGSYPVGEAIIVRIHFSDQYLYLRHLRLVSQSPEDVGSAIALLAENPVDLTWLSANELRIDANTPESGILFLSIPYDSGWSIKVNGQPAEMILLADAFIGIRLEAGNNTIEMSFFPAGLATGIAVSLSCFAAAVSLSVYLRKKRSLPKDAK